MNISAPFIQRPIATLLLMVGLLVGGLVTYRLLPVAALPNVNYPTLQVTAQLPGADPKTMASSVATPLELQFGQIPGLTQMTSASALGFTQITLQFDLSRGIDGCVSDTLSAINAASCQRLRIELYADGRFLLTADTHQSDAGDLRDLLQQNVFRISIDCGQRQAVGRHAEHQDRGVRRIDLPDRRRIR